MKLVITRIIGGLGNQMFQYAAGRAMALRTEAELKVDISGFADYPLRRYVLGDLAVTAPAATAQEIARFNFGGGNRISQMVKRMLKWPVYREPHFHFDPAVLGLMPPVYLDGYFQSLRYFADFEDTIRADFALAHPMTSARAATARQIEETGAISVHVRRGDYVSDPTTNAFHGTCAPDWYAEAMTRMAAEVDNPTFAVFSDDPAWARDNLPDTWPRFFVDPQQDGRDAEDMHLMARCRHHIIANSSFSWWGAWLNPSPDKRVIAPKLWFANPVHDVKDLLPPTWQKL